MSDKSISWKYWIETQDVPSLLDSISTRMVASRSNFKVIQAELYGLLFGPLAVIQPRDSLLFILKCLEVLSVDSAGGTTEGPRMAATGDSTQPAQQPVWHRNPGSISHLLVEIVPSKGVTSEVVPSKGVTSEDLRACAEIAAQLVERRCLVPSNARLAAKVIQLFKLRSEDIKDWQAVVDFVAQLLSDRSTFLPALALMLNLEVGSAIVSVVATCLDQICYQNLSCQIPALMIVMIFCLTVWQ